MDGQLKTNVGNLIGSNKKLKTQLTKKDEQIANLRLENEQMKQGMYKKILKGEIEKQLDFIDSTKRTEPPPAPPQPVPSKAEDSDDEDPEYARAMLVIKRKEQEKAQRQASKNIEAYREARRETIRAKIKAKEEALQTFQRATERDIATLEEGLKRIDRGEHDAEIIKEIADRAGQIKIVAETTVKRTGQTYANPPNTSSRAKVERIAWENLTSYPHALRFLMKGDFYTARVVSSTVVCCRDGTIYPSPSAWCSGVCKKYSGNGTSKSVFEVGKCQATPTSEWVSLWDKEKNVWNF